jgi:hypothetical protein
MLSRNDQHRPADAAGTAGGQTLTGIMEHAPRGHRSLPHTADVMIEAWGADLAACCEEAAAALAELYAEAGDAVVVAERELSVPPGPPGDMLLDLLDEVVFALDVAEGIPIGARVRPGTDGAWRSGSRSPIRPASSLREPSPRRSPAPASR